MQQFRYTVGKNSTDSFLIIEPMGLLNSKRLRVKQQTANPIVADHLGLLNVVSTVKFSPVTMMECRARAIGRGADS